MIREVKKIWYGDKSLGKAKITLRSYDVGYAISQNESIKVIYEGREMILTPRKLAKPIGVRPFKSKIGGRDYSLLDFYWNPIE